MSSMRLSYGGQFSSSDSSSKHMPPVMVRNNSSSDGSSLHPIKEYSNGNGVNYFALVLDKAKPFFTSVLQAWNNTDSPRRAVVVLSTLALFWLPLLLLSWGIVSLIAIALMVHVVFFGLTKTRQDAKQAVQEQFGVDLEALVVRKGKQVYKMAKVYWNVLLGYLRQLFDLFISGLLYVTRTIKKQNLTTVISRAVDSKSASLSATPSKKHHQIYNGDKDQ